MEEIDNGTSNNLVEEEEEERDEEEVRYAEEEDENEEEEEGEENQEEEEEEGDEMEYDVRFEGELNPLDIMNNDTSGVQLFQELQRLEYEALHDKNKKRTAPDTPNQGEGSVKRPRQEETYGKTFEEMMELLCGKRKRSRKSKKRGRRKGSRKKLSPEITNKLGDANLHYAQGHYEEAISVAYEVVRLAPNLPDPYHTLALVHGAMGNKKKAMDFYLIAASLGPKDSSLWKLLVTWFIEEGKIDEAWHCLKKAIRADPNDISLRYYHASIYMETGDYQKAAESYYQIVQICPDNVDALRTTAMLYKRCGDFERSVSILENYVENHPPEADLTVVEMLASLYMENNEHIKALQHIDQAKQVYCVGKEFPLHLTIREGICHAHLGNMEKAEICFDLLRRENGNLQMGLVIAAANTLMDLHHYESALKYYLMLEVCASNNEIINVKIARCYSALKETTLAIQFFYRALQACEDDIDTRLTLASLLLEENREEEAILLLSPPPNPVNDTQPDRPQPWWCNVKVKLKLSRIYNAKGMLEPFVEIMYPIIQESLTIDMHQKVKQRRETPSSELRERVKILGEEQTDSLFGNFRRPVPRNDLVKANRAKEKLRKKQTSKEEKKSAALAAGLDWESDDSDNEEPQQPLKEPPLPDLFKDEEHYDLISDLCTALTSLRRYGEALEIIKLTLKITDKTLPADKKEKFWSFGAKISLNITDPFDGFDYVRYMVQQCPQSIPAWNCYYKLVLRLENRLSKHNKFLRKIRDVLHKDLVPPMLIYGNQYTMISHHQAAAREYLEAYKQMPECPLVNLCVGTALVNLALGHRLQNKHQCVAQGLAFLYNNLRLCENSQESLYNIARALHHVGLFSLAASYYEKVLAINQEDCPFPEVIKEVKDPSEHPKPGYCSLRREAAYNLHLIYKRSGAVDLARQVLKDYCTV